MVEDARVSLGIREGGGGVLKEVPSCSHRPSPAAIHPLHSFTYSVTHSLFLVTMLERQVTRLWQLPSWSLQPVGERCIEQITAHVIIDLCWGKCHVAEGSNVLKETQQYRLDLPEKVRKSQGTRKVIEAVSDKGKCKGLEWAGA